MGWFWGDDVILYHEELDAGSKRAMGNDDGRVSLDGDGVFVVWPED